MNVAMCIIYRAGTCLCTMDYLPPFLPRRFHSLTLNTCTYNYEAQGMDIVAADVGNFNHHRTKHDE